MPNQYCFVCASNEGVFLDVTPDNRSTFGDQVETCLSIKINESVDLSNKICYKCAYELDQCTKFVQKYKKSHKLPYPKAKASTPCCFLCCELVESDRIFDITKDSNVIFNPIRKIRSIFNDDVGKRSGDSKLICLTCRYNLDVLYDLKRIYQETLTNLKALINKEITYSDFPKVHTEVVNRKTTITTFPDITFYGSVNSDSDSNEENMARNKRHVRTRKGRSDAQTKLRTNKSKVRTCDKCHSEVATGIGMYRFYHTGLTVCKNCWITMDPSSAKPQRRSRNIQLAQSTLTETKLCAVFLTDVLSQDSQKKEKPSEVEKDKDDNTSYGSSQEEAKSCESSSPSISFKSRNHIVNGSKARRGRKRRIGLDRSRDDDVERTPLKVTRLNKERASTNEMKPVKASIEAESSTQQSSALTKKQGRKRTLDDKSSDSDGSLKQRETRRIKSDDRVNKTDGKKRKTVPEATTSYTRTDSSDDMSNEDNMSLQSRIKVVTSSSTIPITKEKERNTRSRTRSSSMSSTEMTSMEFKNPKSKAQLETKSEYACDKCNKKFDTKLSNAKHRLTHLKQASLKLKKLTVSTVKEKQETELDSQDEKISEETMPKRRSRRTKSVDTRTDDPSEEITINIEDNTDDEKVSSVSSKNRKKKMKKKVKDEDGDVVDKSDVVKGESPIEKESANDGSIETTESENCEKSKIVSDETIEIEDDKDRQDKDTEDEHTIDKDKTSASRDNDTSKDEDVQETTVATQEDHENVDEKKDKDVEIENSEVCSAENEKPSSKCNNDKDDLHEETVHDDERIRSPILPIHNTTKDNEDCSESCKNNCKDDKDETIEEPEMQCDLIDESSKNDSKESEENVQHSPLPSDKTEILTDETEILNDETEILNDETEILNDETEILNDETEMLSGEPEILNDKILSDNTEMLSDNTEILNEKTGILSDETEILNDQTELLNDKIEMLSDETEILSDKKDLNDIIVENEDNIEELETQQNRFDEENMEMFADFDKPNSAKDITSDLSNGEKHNEVKDNDENAVLLISDDDSNDDGTKHKKVTEEMIPTTNDSKHERKLEEELKELEQLVENNAMNDKYEIQENSTYIPDNSSADAANEILQEVFELAATEVQQREDLNINTKSDVDVELETLENISREIRKSADMPSLDPIIMDMDDDNGITLD